MQRFWPRFVAWYDRHRTLHTLIVSVLFLWQLTHLYWLTTHVVAMRLLGYSLFDPSPLWQLFLIIADYGEIPALISANALYLTSLTAGNRWKNLGFLILVNSQWLHLFWITDEFVVDRLKGTTTASVLPLWLAWVAIGIDYLELPVMYDTIKQSIMALRRYFASSPTPHA